MLPSPVPDWVGGADVDSIGGEKNLEDIAGWHEFAESEKLVVPKLCLFTAITAHCDIMRVTFQHSIGSCAGVMVTDVFWQAEFRAEDSAATNLAEAAANQAKTKEKLLKE